MKMLRVGIVGVGNIGSSHAGCIKNGEVDGMVLTALCDISSERRKLLGDEYDLPVFSSHEELVKSGLCDMIIVSTPHYFHPEISLYGLESGCHVLVEKPIGVDTASVRELCKVAEKSQKLFGIMFNQRTDPLFKKAREIVASGKLGVPKRLIWIVTNWYRTQFYYDSGGWRGSYSGEGGGVLINQAPHNLDLWQWIFGMPKRLRAFCSEGKYHNISVEDDATIYAEYENGAVATFITSTGETPGTNRLEISGDLGKLILEDGKLKWWRLDRPERELCFNERVSFFSPDTECEEFNSNQEISGHKMVLQSFANAVLKGENPVAYGVEGINELTLSNAAYLSAWTDSWVELPIDQELFSQLLREKASTEVKTLSEDKSVKKEESDKGYSDRWAVRW